LGFPHSLYSIAVAVDRPTGEHIRSPARKFAVAFRKTGRRTPVSQKMPAVERQAVVRRRRDGMNAVSRQLQPLRRNFVGADRRIRSYVYNSGKQ
jgi:hypothetical protein